MKTKNEQMFENIYDILKGGQFYDIAKKEFYQWRKNKAIEWNGSNGGSFPSESENTIKIGKNFVIKLVKK